MRTVTVIVIFASLICISNSANILFFFGISTYSHRIVAWPLVEELAKKHSVTFLSPFPPKHPNPNVTEFIPEALSKLMNDLVGADSDLLAIRYAGDHQSVWFQLPFLGIEMCKTLFSHQESLEWMNKQKFDLVVIDALLNDCGIGLAHKFKAQHIIFDTTAPFMWQNDVFGFSVDNSWIPDQQVAFPQQMSFLQKVDNTLRPLGWYFLRTLYMFPILEDIMKKEIPDLPLLADLERNASLVLTNNHFSVDYPRPLPSNIIPVGGLHILPNHKPLPKDMEDFIAKYPSGFIYISFGSAVQIAKLSDEFQSQFFNALRAFDKVGFLWKWDQGNHRPKNLPNNVFTSEWMPQQAILAHPKAKAFITHGGLMSIEESVLSGVPLIVFPVFAEQDYNAEKVGRVGYGIPVEFREMTQSILQDAISKILNDKKYSEKVKVLSRLFKDRQSDPLETAVWWTEYVLRNPDAREHMTPLGIHQTWYERRLLDVWLFLFLVTMTPFLLFTYLLFKCCCKSKGSSKKKVKKQ